MTGMMLVLLLSTGAGFVLTPSTKVCSGAGRVCFSLLSGIGLFYIVLILHAAFGFKWSWVSAGATVAAISLIVFRLRPRGAFLWSWPEWGRGKDLVRVVPIAVTAALTVWLLAGYLVYATTAPVFEFDYLANWGFKAKTFYQYRGINWDFLQRTWYVQTHADYPLLLPLLISAGALFNGSWDDRAAGLIYPFLAAAVLLLSGSVLRRQSGSLLFGLAGALALVPFAATPWIGLAEAPLIAYVLAGVLAIRESSPDDRAQILLGASMLGFAASTKNEGLTFAACAVVAAVLSRHLGRGAWHLWPALAIPAPWIIAKQFLGVKAGLLADGSMGRLTERLLHPAQWIAAISQNYVGRPLFWSIVAILLVVHFRRGLRERFLLMTVTLQILCVAAAYLSTPYDIDWHFRWSWDRVISQIALILALVALLTLGRFLNSNSGRSETSTPPGSAT